MCEARGIVVSHTLDFAYLSRSHSPFPWENMFNYSTQNIFSLTKIWVIIAANLWRVRGHLTIFTGYR